MAISGDQRCQWGTHKPPLSLQGWKDLGIGTPGPCPQVAWLLLTLLVALGATPSNVGGAVSGSWTMMSRLGWDGTLPVWQGSYQKATKLTPPGLPWWWLAEAGQAQLRFGNVALISPPPSSTSVLGLQ